MPNRLKNEKSPYLLQHKDNPVDWYPWCAEAFDRAAREDKPVFLSIGYSACHWCHVMARESFEDGEVARLLNRDFVSVKVDREERPDIDAVYISVCTAMTGAGGWPLTILMTPEGKPFFAATYLPRRSDYRQFGLVELLETVAVAWKHRRQELVGAGEQIAAAIRQRRPRGTGVPDRALLHRAFASLRRRFDPRWGGFGPAPKFPSPHDLLFLMAYGQAERRPEGLRMAETTLEAMARGGLQDHIGGGFSRYSTDEKWLVPHFEKMLYDNALLLLAYTAAYQRTGKAFYADVARRTADYVLREMTGGEGGFCCSQDADCGGVEGKYYVFTPEEVCSVLGDGDGAEFCRRYGIAEPGNFDGKSIPNRIGQTKSGWERGDPRLSKLYAYRLERGRLHRDDKVLLAWNSWMILALARAGTALGERSYLDAALRAERFLRSRMTDGAGRLYLCCRAGEAVQAGQLEDYAVYALALLELYRVTFEPDYLGRALRRAEQMRSLFEDRAEGGYFMTAVDSEKLISRPKEIYDGAIPSGNTAAAMVLERLARLTGAEEWRRSADRQLGFLAGVLSETPSGGSFGLLAMMGELYPHRELICVSAEGVPEELRAFLSGHPAEGLTVLVKTPAWAQALAEYAPYTKAYPLPDRGAVYYLCEGGSCQAPVSDFSKLGLEA